MSMVPVWIPGFGVSMGRGNVSFSSFTEQFTKHDGVEVRAASKMKTNKTDLADYLPNDRK